MSTTRNKPAAAAPTQPAIPGTRERDLEAQLVAERTARLAAETKVQHTEQEIEELTASLFEEANKLVADERRAYAEERKGIECAAAEERHAKEGLEARIKFLEQRDAMFGMRVQVVEERERERMKRMDLLERGWERVERVRGLLVPR
jgi:hypothetical protein